MDEITALRRDTTQMIRQAPTLISLWRPAKLVKDGYGGMKRESNPIPLEPKERYLAPVMDLAKNPTLANVEFEEGKRLLFTHVLVCEYDDDVEEGDYFFMGEPEVKYTLARLTIDTSYQKKFAAGTEQSIYVNTNVGP